MSKEQDRYQKYAAAYDRSSEECQWYGPQVLFGLMYRYVRAGEKLLDLGIGTGLGSEDFHRAGLEVFGMDSSQSMLAECRKKGIARDLRQHSLIDVPWPYSDGAFDHVISTGVTHFLGELNEVIEEVARILKPGGIFGFDVSEYGSADDAKYTSLAEGVYTRVEEDWGHTVYCHTPDYIMKVLSDNHFKVECDTEFLVSREPKRYFRMLICRLVS